MLLPAPASACRLALVLAIDVSSSVDATEDRLQRLGLAAALTDPEVVAAFLASDDPVALAVFEWSGRFSQVDILPLAPVMSADHLARAAAIIAQSPRSRTDMPTAAGYALGHAATLLARGPDCLTRTVDMAGDGVNNEGFGPADAYAAFDFSGVVVNGLMIAGGDYIASGNLLAFYQGEVRHGPGAFIEVADGFDDYAAAMRRKLLRELMLVSVSGEPMATGPRG